MVGVRRVRIAPTAEDGIANRLPVYGRQGANLLDTMNYLAGWRFRRCPVVPYDYPVGGIGVSSVFGATGTWRLRHRLDENAEYLWAAISYIAGADSSCTVSCSTVGGATVDNGCGLPLTITRVGDRQRIPAVAHTGFEVYDTTTATDYPRPLYVTGASDPNVEVIFDTEYVRIYSATVWEMWQDNV